MSRIYEKMEKVFHYQHMQSKLKGRIQPSLHGIAQPAERQSWKHAKKTPI